MKLGEKLTILDRTIQFNPNKYFIPLEQMIENEKQAREMVRTDDLQIKSPAFQHGSLSWLTLADELRTASIDFDKNRLLVIKEVLGCAIL